MQYYALLTVALAARATADCACGYVVNKTVERDFAVFTDMIETDFLHTYDFTAETAHSIGWVAQSYFQPNGSGPYGTAKKAENAVANPLASIWDWGGEGVRGGDPGLQLWVKSDMVYRNGSGYVPTAEIVSERDDILYGSFRIAMKTTSVNGTCAAFFFYRNDTQEIDIELLSAQQYASISQWPVNLVVQNTTQQLAPFAADPRSSSVEYHLVEPPNGGLGEMYHEYRFDWLPDRIDFYVDAWHTWTFTENVPSSPGAMHFSHWSDGNPGWSRGPPLEDAVMTVAYVKAYFNTTSPRPFSSHDCESPQWRDGNNALCQIPDQSMSPWPGGPDGNVTGNTFFFSRQMTIEHNMSRNHHQTMSGPREGSAHALNHMREKALYTLIAVVGAPVIAGLMYLRL